MTSLRRSAAIAIGHRRLDIAVIATFLIICTVLSGVASAPCAFAQDATDDEIKAALAFKFPVYVRWPESALNDDTETFNCCTMGNGALPELLMQLDGVVVMDKSLRVTRISNIAEIASCHMLFIGASEKKNLENILVAIKKKPILTLGDMKGFARKGGMINFYLEKNSVRFEINPEAGRQAGLDISSKLLRLARIVEGDK